MKIDLNKYLPSKSIILAIFDKNKNVSYSKIISIISISTMVPVIVVAFWIGEASNWPDEVTLSIKRFISFYKYTKIENKPENSPI